MIVAVKKNSQKKQAIKIAATLFLVFFVIGYSIIKYQESTTKHEQEIKLQEELLFQKNLNEQKEKEKNDAERIILIEVEKVVDLVGQEYVDDIKVLKNKIVYVLRPNTNIEAISIRYGAMALIKRSFKEIVVVVDIEHILKSRLK